MVSYLDAVARPGGHGESPPYQGSSISFFPGPASSTGPRISDGLALPNLELASPTKEVMCYFKNMQIC